MYGGRSIDETYDFLYETHNGSTLSKELEKLNNRLGGVQLGFDIVAGIGINAIAGGIKSIGKSPAKIADSTIDDLIASANAPHKGQIINGAGRAVMKHPEYFDFNSTAELQKVYRTDAALNALGNSFVKEVLEHGTKTTGAGGRWKDGWVTYTLPDGRAASWSNSGEFIGFRGVR